ncbi:hypothetical protein KX729_27790 [Rhizobium sp. XQZ8]|uniref:DUF6894 family protein n=1 Tax=Rhizobium populisoli TaxID=2859785 RepID=UPI001CA5C617|nr:hypothetical protein [Rhizobium populisoli]MBW6425237.1 hypothetical protein [Rhizobium populisoli]
MPRYFFDIVNGQGPMRDDEGVELLDPETVRKVAARIVSDLARDEMPGEQAVEITVNVRDESDRKVFIGKMHFAGQWQS